MVNSKKVKKNAKLVKLTLLGQQIILILIMSLENLVNKPLIVILSNISINLAHHFTKFSFCNSFIIIDIRFESFENILLEVASNDWRVLKWIKNGGDKF